MWVLQCYWGPVMEALRVLPAAVLFAACAAAQVQLEVRFSDSRASFVRVLPWRNGDRLLIGTGPLPFDYGLVPQTEQITLISLQSGFFYPRGGSGNDIV